MRPVHIDNELQGYKTDHDIPHKLTLRQFFNDREGTK